MQLAAGAAGYGMASSVWPLRAVVAIGAAAADSELGRFHCDVVIRVVVVEARGRSRRRHRGCRRRLGERQRPDRSMGAAPRRRAQEAAIAADRCHRRARTIVCSQKTTPSALRRGVYAMAHFGGDSSGNRDVLRDSALVMRCRTGCTAERTAVPESKPR